MAIPSISTLKEFEKIINNHDRVVVFFSAAWIGACRDMRTAFEQCAAKFPSLYCIEVDIDQNPRTAQFANATTAPSFKAFRGGTPSSDVDMEGSSASFLEKSMSRFAS
ncbi:MAG: thioredoxin family protein [Cyanobacteriota bacterium]|jgi:thioredoxin-like negative regulator of GroEL